MIRPSTSFIVIHCAATRPSQDVGAADIRKWHKAKGWADIGYHWVIRRNGKIEKGRAENLVGAHEPTRNRNSVGICLVGGVSEKDFTKAENNFTPEQWAALSKLVKDVQTRYPKTRVMGHRDCPNVKKACPSFDAIKWAKAEGFATP
jgi:N-acetylmuramoyl-L-alanine amidase